MEEVKISKAQLLKGYRGASEESKELLKSLFGEDVFASQDIKERVKTFEDACEVCKELGLGYLVDAHDAFWHEVHASVGGEYLKDVDAYLSLRIICAALNEGWGPEFTEDEYRHYPWFYLYTEEELARRSEEWKKSHTILDLTGRVVGRAFHGAGADGGCVYAVANVASSPSAPNGGARLAFKTEDLAIYAGKQFIEIYAEFLLNFGEPNEAE